MTDSKKKYEKITGKKFDPSTIDNCNKLNDCSGFIWLSEGRAYKHENIKPPVCKLQFNNLGYVGTGYNIRNMDDYVKHNVPISTYVKRTFEESNK